MPNITEILILRPPPFNYISKILTLQTIIIDKLFISLIRSNIIHLNIFILYTQTFNLVNHRQDRMKLETEVDQKLNNLKKEKRSILRELNALKEKEMESNDGTQSRAPSAASQQDVSSNFMEVLQLQGELFFYYCFLHFMSI